MVSTVTTKAPLGATTLNRKWYLDVDTSPTTPTWIGVFGIQEFKPTKSPTTQDTSDFDGEGWKGSEVTALEWGVEFKVRRGVKKTTPTVYDPGQELLRLASDAMGTENNIHIRYYEVTNGGPAVEAYEGYVNVSWEPDGGGMDATDTVSVKLNGKGKRLSIAHPAGA